MKLFRAYQKEINELQFSVWIALALFFYTFSIFSVEALKRFLHPAMENSLMWTGVNMLVVWLLGLIALSYLRYQRVSLDSKELEAMIQGMNTDVVLVINPDRKIMICNEGITKVLGYGPEEVLSQKTELLYKDRREPKGENVGIYEQLEKLGFHVGYATGLHKEGHEVPLEIVTGNLRGRPGAVLQIRDVTKLAHVEKAVQVQSETVDELEDSLHRLKEAETARDNLTQMIVHDMKTPLQIILGNLELMQHQMFSNPAEQEKAVATALGQTTRLVDMTNSILEVSRLESGGVELDRSAFDLRETVSGVLASLEGVLKNQRVVSDVPEEVCLVHADADIMGRVLMNLVSNALQHAGPDARVEVRLKKNNGLLRLSVEDDGPGIAAEVHDRVFQKFTRFSRSPTAGGSSTGLGLTFCKLAVEAHDGFIGFESEPDQGCTFWVDLPILDA